MSDAEWERIWTALPNTRANWEQRARQVFEDLNLAREDLGTFHAWLRGQCRRKGWIVSPPTPLSVADDFGAFLRREKATREAEEKSKAARKSKAATESNGHSAPAPWTDENAPRLPRIRGRA